MATNKFTGVITNILPIKEGTSQKGAWASIGFVVEEQASEENKYPQKGVFNLMKSGEYITHVQNFTKYNPVGTTVEVEYNLRANEYQGKWYGDNSVFKVTKIGEAVAASVDEVEDDGLPF